MLNVRLRPTSTSNLDHSSCCDREQEIFPCIRRQADHVVLVVLERMDFVFDCAIAGPLCRTWSFRGKMRCIVDIIVFFALAILACARFSNRIEIAHGTTSCPVVEISPPHAHCFGPTFQRMGSEAKSPLRVYMATARISSSFSIASSRASISSYTSPTFCTFAVMIPRLPLFS